MKTYYGIVSGHDFYPKKLPFIETLNVAQVFEKGDLCAARGSLYDCGYLRISLNSLLDLCAALEKIRGEAKDSIDELIIHIVYLYEAQCNLEFSVEEMHMLSGLDAVLTISCEAL